MTNKSWGGRFKKELNPLVKKFGASLPFDHVLYKHDILGSQVHARMLARQNLLTLQESEEIIKALDVIRKELEESKHQLDDAYEDIHMFIEHLLIQKIGDTGKKLHTGRSRNDQVALDLRLYAREEGGRIKNLLLYLIETLDKLATTHPEDMMPGYTHLQQAQPISLGNYIKAYISMFQRDLKRLEHWYQEMNYSPLGAGALAGSTLPLDREYVAKELGFNGVIHNTIDAVSDRDYLIELCSLASITMMHLSRLCEDLIIWSTSEFNFITLDDAFATGSSLMPNKKNPDVPELIRGKTGRVFGHLLGLLTVMKGLPLAYNKDMQEDKEAIFDTIKTLTSSLEVMAPFMQSIKFNTTIMSKASKAGYLNATRLLESLVLKGTPFRDAHHQVGSWVAEAMDKGISLDELLKSKDDFN
jgi:argininosuccinate lyase